MTCATLVTKERCDCITSLNEYDYELHRDQLCGKRHEGTCTWIFSHKDYRRWVEDDDHPILWIHGGPGFGKTVLSAALSKELISDQHTRFDQGCSVAYFFYDDKDDRLKTPDALLTNILGQLLKQDPKAFIHFSNEPAYNSKRESTVWAFGMLWNVFSLTVKDENLKP
jgi:Cdc6-like AAA superfamily ATPase